MAFFKEIHVKHQKKYGYDKKHCFYQHTTQSFRHTSLDNKNFPVDWNLKSTCSATQWSSVGFSTSSLRDVRSENGCRKHLVTSVPKWRNIAASNWGKNTNYIMAQDNMDVSENRGPPKWSILIGFSIINHPFWGIPIFGNIHMETNLGFLPICKPRKHPFFWQPVVST